MRRGGAVTDAKAQLSAVGPVLPGQFEHPNVSRATEESLSDAGLIDMCDDYCSITAKGRKIYYLDAACRQSRLCVVDGEAEMGH